MIRSLCIYLSGGLATAFFAAITTFLLTHFLSPSDYGLGMLFLSLASLLSCICSAGMNQVFMRYFYEAEYQHRIDLLLYRCLFFVSIISLILAMGLLFFHKMGESLFGYNGYLLWLLLMLCGILLTLSKFIALIPQFFQKPIHSILQQVPYPLINVILIAFFCFFFRKNGILIIIAAQLFSLLMSVIISIYFYRKIWLMPNDLFTHFNFSKMKKFIHYGFPLIFSYGLEKFSFNIDKFLLLKWSTAHQLGIYTAAFVLSSPLVRLQEIFESAWLPRRNQLLVTTPFKGKKAFYDTFHQTLWIFTILVMALLLLKSILLLLLGKEFQKAGDIFGWLLLTPYFFALSDIVSAGIVKSEKTYWNAIVGIACLLTNATACYFLIPLFSAQGAAMACALTFFMFFLSRYIIGFHYYSFKIIRWKLLLYIVYVCGMISLSSKNLVYLQLEGTAGFLLMSFWLEKQWLIPYFKRLSACLKSRDVSWKRKHALKPFKNQQN